MLVTSSLAKAPIRLLSSLESKRIGALASKDVLVRVSVLGMRMYEFRSRVAVCVAHKGTLTAKSNKCSEAYVCHVIRPNKKICVVLVTRPTLDFTPDPTLFFSNFQKSIISTYLTLPDMKLFKKIF